MAGNFLILCILSSMLVSCQGQIKSPTNGTTLTFLPGTNGTIDWSLTVSASAAQVRTWNFNSSDGSKTGDLTVIYGDNNPGPKNLSLIPRFEIEKPATLILMNVDETYNGMYTFTLLRKGITTTDTSEVTVYIAVTPNITINCSSPTTVNQSDYVACECKGTNGNPPADVTWYKGNRNVTASGKEKAILVFSHVKHDDSETYICEAKSGIEKAKKTTEFELIVNYPPENVTLTLNRRGHSANMTCTAKARPNPSFEIFVNETMLVKSNKTYIILEVNSSHVGNYTCVAMNVLGNASSDPKYVSLVEPTTTPLPTTIAPTPSIKTSVTITTSSTGVPPGLKPTSKQKKGNCRTACIVGIVGGVLVVILIIVVAVYYCKKRTRNGYKGNANVNPDDGKVVVNHYELEEDNAYNSVKDDNAYDSVNPPGSSASTSKPPEDTMPPVYAAVDKNNREGKTLYATLDSVALESDGSQKRKDDRPPPTEYADINFLKKEPDQNAGEAV